MQIHSLIVGVTYGRAEIECFPILTPHCHGEERNANGIYMLSKAIQMFVFAEVFYQTTPNTRVQRQKSQF